ncbi:MAG: metallophosphoesterase family protein [Bacteroidia bacterium]
MNKYFFFIAFFFSSLLGFSQQSPFNKLSVQIQDSSNFSFVVSGHFYGSSSNRSGFPASTLLANLDTLNSSNAAFIVCLGDLFMDVKNDIPNYKKSLFSKLSKPLFNVVGNHDLSANVYQENFGKTHFSFSTGENTFVFLDTEKDNGDIKNEQFDLLKNAVESHAKNVFIFSHRTVWAEENKTLSELFKDNTRSRFGNNFQKEILPLLETSRAHVYWFSGSMGGGAKASFFYHPKSEKITYITTAIRDLPRDAVLNVNIQNGDVFFNTQSLTENEVLVLKEYNLDYWKTTKIQEINYRLFPIYIKQLLFHKFFWIGLLIGLLIMFLFVRFKKS